MPSISNKKDLSTPKRPLAVYGNPGTEVYGGWFQEEPNAQWRDDNRVDNVETMRRTDGAVAAILHAIKAPILSTKWYIEYKGDNKQIHEFVEKDVFEMKRTFTDFLREALSYFDFGFYPFEQIYEKRKDGKIHLADLEPRIPHSVLNWPIKDGQRYLVQLLKTDEAKTTEAEIPFNKLFLLTNQKEGDDVTGQALALDTLISTPNGYKEMKDLIVGDQIFDDEGKIRYVTATKEWKDRPCYEIIFTNGEKIIADANHQWLALYGARNKQKLVTTEEMSKKVKYGNGKHNLWKIPCCEPFEYPEQDLFIHPYVLGQWLGDGHKAGAQITSADDDFEGLIEECGYKIMTKAPNTTSKAITYRIEGMQDRLRWYGLIDNKHIPKAYMRGSIEQRLALVQGLMDSDGTVDKRNGYCEFSNCNKKIVDGIIDLLFSLGIKASWHSVEPTGKRKQEIWRVHFKSDLPVFRLKRKLQYQQERTNKSALHFISEVKKVENRDTKCIEVDSPSHLYLAGRTAIPTHNSILRPAWKHFYAKDKLYRIGLIASERYGVGVPKITLPEGSGETEQDEAEELAKNFRANEKSYMVLPNDGWKFEIVTTQNTGQNSIIEEQIKHHNREILSSILAGFIGLGSDSAGSFALSKDQSSFFLKHVQDKARYISEHFTEQVIKRLVMINFGKQEVYPQLSFTPLGDINYSEYANTLKTLAEGGIIVIDSKLKKFAHQTFELPELTDEDLENQEAKDDMKKDITKKVDTEIKKEPAEKEKEDIEEIPEQKMHEYIHISCLSQGQKKKFKPFRKLTVYEKRAKLIYLNESFDDIENRLKVALADVIKDDLIKGIKKVEGKIKAQDVAGIANVNFVNANKVNTVIKDFMKEAIEIGKKSAAKEMNVERPSTPTKNTQLSNFEAKQIANEFRNEVNRKGQETAREGILKNVPPISVTASVSITVNKYTSRMITNLIGAIPGEYINIGRRIVFNKYIVQLTEKKIELLKTEKVNRVIGWFQRSEILDSKTCNLCMSLDGRVVKFDDPFAQANLIHDHCRGMWIPIYSDEPLPTWPPGDDEKGNTVKPGLPKTILDSFETIGGAPVKNAFTQLKKPINKANVHVAEEVARRLKK